MTLTFLSLDLLSVRESMSEFDTSGDRASGVDLQEDSSVVRRKDQSSKLNPRNSKRGVSHYYQYSTSGGV